MRLTDDEAHVTGKLQVISGIRLLTWSQIVYWGTERNQFRARGFQTFAQHWRDVEPLFGRLICWIAFSAGAEYLAKGVCFLNGHSSRLEQRQPILRPPDNDPILVWAKKVCASGGPKIEKPTYKTIGALVYESPKKNIASVFRELGLSADDCTLLIAGYRLLGSAVRNRDAHFYVPNVRDADYSLVDAVFVPRFNILIGAIPPAGSFTVEQWLRDAEQFVAGIPGD